jgi:hypothetical protein
MMLSSSSSAKLIAKSKSSLLPAAAAQVRFHHPDPFNPKQTKGWKAALKVRRGVATLFDCRVRRVVFVVSLIFLLAIESRESVRTIVSFAI